MDTRVCSEGQWPRLDMGLAVARTVRPRRPTRRPLVARRGLNSHRMAQGSGRGRDSKETADANRWKGAAQSQEQALFRRRRQCAKADVVCGEPSHSSQAAGTGKQRRKGQRRRGKLRLSRDLYDPAPAPPRDRARQFPRHQSGWAVFCIDVLFSGETEFTKFVREKIATARARHISRRRWIPMPAGIITLT